MTNCPECGASPVDGLDCWGQLNAVLAWEMIDPELATVHFLTVAAYNLQHPAQFTAAALTEMRTMFVEHLEQGTPTDQLRRRLSQTFEGDQRVLKPEAEQRPVLRHWPYTIADVYLPNHPTNAADRVRHWAATIYIELTK